MFNRDEKLVTLNWWLGAKEGLMRMVKTTLDPPGNAEKKHCLSSE